jgi:3-dehydroquinate dehydratase
MGVLTEFGHEFWATISGTDVDDIVQQQVAVWKWGVAAVEIRADLVPESIYDEVLARRERQGPTFIAHFGTGDEAEAAAEAITKALKAGADGGICHSRCEALGEIKQACLNVNKSFAAAYHSQLPMTLSAAIREFEEQEANNPLFRKIAVRAESPEDAIAIIQATHQVSLKGGTPVVGAVFGPHRWARVALPHAGSAISFLIAHRALNEVNGDDEQLQLAEADHLQSVRGLYPLQKKPVGLVAA